MDHKCVLNKSFNLNGITILKINKIGIRNAFIHALYTSIRRSF